MKNFQIIIALFLIVLTCLGQFGKANAAMLSPVLGFKDIAEPVVLENGRENPSVSPVLDDCLYFIAQGEESVASQDVALWRSCASSIGNAERIKSLFVASAQTPLTSIFVFGHEGLFFVVPQNGELGLWYTDGSPTGTSRLEHALSATLAPLEAANLYFNEDILYFSARSQNSGRELWKAERNSVGGLVVSLVKDINQTGDSEPTNFASIGSLTLFAADDGIHDNELWATDGTTAGTYLVKDLASNCFYGKGGAPRELVEGGGSIFFSACVDRAGRELWVSDGTAEGTGIRDFNGTIGTTGRFNSSTRFLAVHEGYFYYTYTLGPIGIGTRFLPTNTVSRINLVNQESSTVLGSPQVAACIVSEEYGPIIPLGDRLVLRQFDSYCSGVQFKREPTQLAEFDPLSDQLFNFARLERDQRPDLTRHAVSQDKKTLFYITVSLDDSESGIRSVERGKSTNTLLIDRRGGASLIKKLVSFGGSLYAIGDTAFGQGRLWLVDSDGNCPHTDNPPGGECEDFDSDGLLDSQDNCPAVANPVQENLDGDLLGDVCDTDIDGDTLPNDYENENGLNPFNSEDANGDPDQDGFTNIQEFELGSDPQSADSDRNGNGVPDLIDGRRITPLQLFLSD